MVPNSRTDRAHQPRRGGPIGQHRNKREGLLAKALGMKSADGLNRGLAGYRPFGDEYLQPHPEGIGSRGDGAESHSLRGSFAREGVLLIAVQFREGTSHQRCPRCVRHDALSPLVLLGRRRWWCVALKPRSF